MTKPNSHGKIICEECKEVMYQCRCMEGHKNIQYDICEKCKGMTKPKRPEKKPEIAYPLKGESLREFQGFNLCYDLHTPYIKYLEDKIEKLERRIK